MAVAVGHKILLLFLVPIISSSYLFSLPAATSSVELHTNSNDSISELLELKLKISNLGIKLHSIELFLIFLVKFIYIVVG